MSQHKPHGAIPPAPPIEATPEQWQEAREMCAERAICETLKQSYRDGGQDQGFAMRYAIRLVLERTEK